MNHFRRLLTLAAAGLITSAAISAPKPFRLYEIFAVRVTVDNDGFHTIERGLLDSLGAFEVFEVGMLAPSVVPPPQVLNRTLVTLPTWYAYEVLGPDAVANFQVGTTLIEIGVQGYFTVQASAEPKFDPGELVNISTRAIVTPGGEPVIGGFVVHSRHRRVLIRGIGPSLASFDVPHPLPDPCITLYRHGSNQGFAFNDDWGQRPDADEIQDAAARVGAFPLPGNSKDAAYLLELEPGIYTVHLTTTGGTGGTALLEIYALP